jgi:molecular chaperone DnaK
MPRKFVDYGIDLGTTNSCIAVFEQGEARVIKNNEDADYTPSAVYVDEDGTIIVGRSARERLNKDEENATSEFKSQMATNWRKHFIRSGRWMKPEELSAQVLMSLKANCLQRGGQEVSAAVISVPAAFNMAKSDATQAAARLAGIQFSPLVQEPVAAAWAYGFQQRAHKAFWLVYDLGGGTFDAAIVKSRDGIVQVEDNGGDEYLGGKLIDWDIVQELLIPEVQRQAGLADFERGNPRWAGAIATLKKEAEEAKIRLSLAPSYTIEAILQSGDGMLVPFNYRLKEEQVAQLAEPYIRKTISICKRVLSNVNLHPSDIEKVLLVGGPTRMPYLRKLLADPDEGLGIPLESGFDPMTVVAKGAAIYAATFENRGGTPTPPPPDGFSIDLYKYKQFGSDPEPLVIGKVNSLSSGMDFSGYSIEFISSGAPLPWMSGKVPLSAEGKFSAHLFAQEEDKENTFLVELTSPQGAKYEVESIKYTLKGIDPPTAPPLTHSIGIALADNKVDWFFKKGAGLPQASTFHELSSAIFFSKEKEGVALSIPVIVGENERADRNELIGHIEATTERLKEDIKVGDDVKVKLEIDESRVLSVRVSATALQEEIKAVLDLRPKGPEIEELERQIQDASRHLERVKELAVETGDLKSLSLLNDLDKDGIIQEITKKQKDAPTDPASRNELEKRLREFNVRIDEVEKAVEIPWLKLDAQRALATAQGFVDKMGTDLDRQTLVILHRELFNATQARVVDPAELRRRIPLMNVFWRQVWERTDPLGYWLWEFEEMEERPVNSFSNPDMANDLIIQGNKAIYSNEIEKLGTAVRQLWQLLPVTLGGGFRSTVGKKKNIPGT